MSQVLENPKRVYALPRLTWIVLLSIAVVAALMFREGLLRMIDTWINTAEYSHSLLIPPIAAFLVWQRKDLLERLPLKGAWAGVAVVTFGGLLQLIGQLSTLFVIQQYALLIVLYGVVLALVGWRGVRLLAMPLLLLLLVIPLPQFLLYDLSAKLQLISTQIGVLVIRALGISVFVEGNVIDLGSYKLEVAEACSGLRYLFPLMTMGLIIAYFFKAAWWQRAIIFLSSIPVTIFMNSLRIGLIGILVDRWGTGMAEGFIHAFEGWVVFMFSIGALLLEVLLFKRLNGDRSPLRDVFGLDMPAETPPGAARITRPLSQPLLVSAILLLALYVSINFAPKRVEEVPQRTAFARFPTEIASWTGHQVAMDPEYLRALKLDDYILADYLRDGEKRPVNFYVAWYNSQVAGESVHSPRSCIPGGGWRITDFSKRTVDQVRFSGAPLAVNRVVIEFGAQKQLVYYWFQQRGRSITNEYLVKFYLFLDALKLHRTDGALVRLIKPLRIGELPEEADRDLQDFAVSIAPTLAKYVPD